MEEKKQDSINDSGQVDTIVSWRKWGDGKPEIGDLIIYKEKWFEPGYEIGIYKSGKPDNTIEFLKLFTDLVPFS